MGYYFLDTQYNDLGNAFYTFTVLYVRHCIRRDDLFIFMTELADRGETKMFGCVLRRGIQQSRILPLKQCSMLGKKIRHILIKLVRFF